MVMQIRQPKARLTLEPYPLTCPHLTRPQERFYFGDAVLPLFESGIPLLLQRLKQLPDAANVGQGMGLT